MSSIGENSAVEREFAFTDADFAQVVQLVRGYTGIALTESKRELVYGRLVRRLRALRVRSFAQYLQHLERGDQAELQHFCNAITTNLTAFFRENHHFEFLANELVPMLLKRNAARRRIRIWSAGCSSGEEPYSVAIVLHETMPELRTWDVRILATDLDSNVLAHGQRGLYEADRFEKMHARAPATLVLAHRHRPVCGSRTAAQHDLLQAAESDWRMAIQRAIRSDSVP